MIELQALNRHFHVGDQTVQALRDINLSVAAGDYISIMGPSGSGKSSLLHILGLLDHPDSGHYWFEGNDTTQMSARAQTRLRRERIGFVFQFFHLVPRLSAFDNIALPLILAGTPPAQRRARVIETLAAYGLAARADHRPEQLSGGQRQRVAIGRATIMRPALLLADEPTGNLDRAAGHEVVALLEGLQAQGITLIVVTHDPELGGRAQRCLYMSDGYLQNA
jgi:putative ABC transport system ATP-binding protein